jgi:pimeloyl-ACP methyl ester carboxylesterase
MPSSPSKSPPAHTWLSSEPGPADRLTAEGFDLGSYGITAQIDDMEAARTALGYDRIDLLSEGAGTRTANIYSGRHPDSIHRSVMMGVNPPGHFLYYPGTTDEQIDRYAALCVKDAAVVPAQMTSPPHCGKRTPRSRIAGSSCRRSPGKLLPQSAEGPGGRPARLTPHDDAQRPGSPWDRSNTRRKS